VNAVRKRVVALAHAVLDETTEDYTPTDHWTDDDWYMFQYASTTDEQRTEIARFLMDAEKIKQFGQGALRVASSTHNPFSVEDAARRIISDSNEKTGVFEPVWLAVLRHIIARTTKRQNSN
jgi:hypothetical protein